MAKKKNFKNYLNSFSVNHEVDANAPEVSTSQAQDNLEPTPTYEDNNVSETETEDVLGDEIKPNVESEPVVTQSTIIGPDIIIDGSVSATNDINVLGTINGDVVTKGEIYVSGNIMGDIGAKCVYIKCKQIVGNITASEFIDIQNDSKVEGMMTSKDLSIHGQLKGNIFSSGHVVLHDGSIVVGDIESKTLEITKGSSFNGKVTQKS